MSLVIAIKDKNRIVMGCDSQVTSRGMKLQLDNKNCCKIWDIKNCKEGLMGGVGYLRDSQILQTEDNLIDELKIYKNEINYKYVVRDLYNKIYSLLEEYNRIEKDNKGHSVKYINNQLIFAYKDEAYKIDEDGAISCIEDYLVIGCGKDVAIGVLENNKNKSPENRIKEAIKICSEKDCYIDNNVIIKYTIENN